MQPEGTKYLNEKGLKPVPPAKKKGSVVYLLVDTEILFAIYEETKALIIKIYAWKDLNFLGFCVSA